MCSFKWIRLTRIMLFLGLFPIILAHPLVVNKESNSILTLGPCTWVINRKCPDIDVEFYLYTRQNVNDRQFIWIDDTWEKSNLSESYFNPYHPVKIIIHGFNADMFLHPLIQMKDEYLQRGDYNLIYVEWSRLSVGPCYFASVHNSRHVGACIAQLIERILEAGTANIHLIGFSLGAQVTNFAANNLGTFLIPRITGLDPAMPLFIFASKENKLDPSDAGFVDVIHTNALVQGKIERCGHVDFYLNGGIIQPGCFSQEENPFACSHHRAPDYYAESIRSLKGFWGWQCSSYINYLLGLCPQTNYLVLAGEDCNTNTQGMFLINTNSESPFARGKWTDILFKNKPIISKPFTKTNLLSKEIDQWGKLEGNFNNIMNFPTPYSQDPNSGNYPYFGSFGTKEIINIQLIDNYDEIVTHKNEDKYFNKNPVRKTIKKPENTTTVLKPSFKNGNNTSIENSRSKFLEDYKKNLTIGIINNEIFDLPSLDLE